MKKWKEDGAIYTIGDTSKQRDKLPTAVYTLNKSMFGFYLEKIEDRFEFNHKLYGLERSLIDRVIKTWRETNKNLGILLNGLKGTGKTVTSKVICNELNLPVILIGENPDGGGIPEFLNEIEQDVIVFIDEYEKVFGQEADLLTVMDGVLSSTSRKIFLLTTNNTYINDNLLQRPSRIRYHKTFKDLAPDVIEEIVDDVLVHPKFKEEAIYAISNLEVITIDVVKSIIEEINIHNESPKEFMDIFNVRKITGKYSVYVVSDKKDDFGQVIETQLAKGIKIYPRVFDEDSVGCSIQLNGDYFGEILEVMSFDTIKVQPYGNEEDELPTKRGKKTKVEIKPEPVILRIETYDSIHANFRYHNFAF